jgi:hypothetical protein
MEFAGRALTVQRVLAGALLALVCGAAAVESGSPLARRVREGRPWPFWLARRVDGRAVPDFHLGVYDPVRRSLALVRVPELAKLEGKTTLARAYNDALRATGSAADADRAVEDLARDKVTALSLEPLQWDGAGRLSAAAREEAEGEEDDCPEAAAARGLKARGRSPRELWRLLKAAARGLAAGDRAAADPLLLALELRRVPFERLQPALLPDDAAAPTFLARVFAPPPAAADERAIVAEVLNGTDLEGLAKQASKMLRLRGVDVILVGAAGRPRARTLIFDRTGDFSRAARVRDALRCPSAVAATRVDALRAVDATVELGMDCADAVTE